jgi:hypothetical protein
VPALPLQPRFPTVVLAGVSALANGARRLACGLVDHHPRQDPRDGDAHGTGVLGQYGREAHDPVDVWHYRRVEYPVPAISTLDFHGSIKGGVLGPRGTFWSLDRSYVAIDHLAHGRDPGTEVAPDVEVTDAYVYSDAKYYGDITHPSHDDHDNEFYGDGVMPRRREGVATRRWLPAQHAPGRPLGRGRAPTPPTRRTAHDQAVTA